MPRIKNHPRGGPPAAAPKLSSVAPKAAAPTAAPTRKAGWSPTAKAPTPTGQLETIASGSFEGAPGKIQGSLSGPFAGGINAGVSHSYNTNKPGNGFSVGGKGDTNLSVGTSGASGSFQHGVQGGLYGKTEGSTSGRFGDAAYSAQGKLEGGAHVGIQGGRPTAGVQGTAEGEFSASAATKPWSREGASSGSMSGKYGIAAYDAQGKLTAEARLDADGKVDPSGLALNASGRLGAEASGSVGGTLTSRPMKWGDASYNTTASGSLYASGTVGANANGTLRLDPHNAFVEGSAGASMATKLGTRWSVGAGPFTASGNLYGSAGLEATAGGVAGLQDGTFKLGGHAGAAAGPGLGGGFELGVNTAQASQMLSHMANNPFRMTPEARQQLQQAHAGYYQNVAAWVDGDSHLAH